MCGVRIYCVPCGCGRPCGWCASWPEDLWSAVVLQVGWEWTAGGWPTLKLQPYFSPNVFNRKQTQISTFSTHYPEVSHFENLSSQDQGNFCIPKLKRLEVLAFSMGEPTAKQLSRASSELTTNLKIRQQLD